MNAIEKNLNKTDANENRELTLAETEAVAGGTSRDGADGQATGRRGHEQAGSTIASPVRMPVAYFGGIPIY
jgi:hypothetical protein